jgi:transcriptional regulator with XRE-family HTH domain
MNLHTTIPLDDAPPIPAADDAVARLLSDARLTDENALLDALDARRVELGLSHESLNELSGLAVGYAAKLLAPGRPKSPSLVTLDRIMAALGLSWVLVIDPKRFPAYRRHGGRAMRRMSAIGRCRPRSWRARGRTSSLS